MQHKLTISIDGDVYRGLHALIGRGNIGRFLENLARPFVCEDALAAGYRAMTANACREAEAETWAEAHLPDIDDDESW